VRNRINVTISRAQCLAVVIVTRLQRLNLTDSQQRDAVTYEPEHIAEFHKIAKGALRGGVQERRFKCGEQWEVLRRRRELYS
jgi:hypothetical protein